MKIYRTRLNRKKSDILIKDNYFLKLHDYFKHNYDIEKDRIKHLNDSTKGFLTLEIFTFSAIVFKLDVPSMINEILKIKEPTLSITPTLLIIISLLLIFGSFLATLNGLRMRRFERLNNLGSFMKIVHRNMVETEVELIKMINADYQVATERNYTNNQRKSYWLKIAFICYIFGLGMLFFGWIIPIFINCMEG